MAPELFEQPYEMDLEALKKLDLYALGMILSDLVCNPISDRDFYLIDESLKQLPPELPP
jgi:hypothetical protein